MRSYVSLFPLFRRTRLATLCASILLLGSLPSVVSAEWLSLFESNVAPDVDETGSFNSGRDAFSAFGCVECHQGLTDKSYQSGFRVLDGTERSSTALSLMYSDIMRLGSAARSGVAPSPSKAHQYTLQLGQREYRQAEDNSAVFLRYVHSEVQGARSSLMLFERGEEAERKAVIDYVLMF